MGDDECRPVEVADDVGHGERLAGSGDTKQRLVWFTGEQTSGQFPDRLGLIPRRLEGGMKSERLAFHKSGAWPYPSRL